MMQKGWAELVLRIGAAFAFLYPPINAFFDPDSWIGYFPGYVLSMWHGMGLPDLVLLHCFGIVEVVLGLWILSGKKVFYPSVLATAMLAGIVVTNLPQFQITFRDLSIACLTLGLA